MHEPNDIIRLLARLNLHFPRSGARTAAELAVLAEDLAADLAPWPFEVVERAFVCARRECEFWPSTARLRDLCARTAAEIERQRQREIPSLEMTDEANIERGRRWCAVIVERLRRQGFEGRVRSTRPAPRVVAPAVPAPSAGPRPTPGADFRAAPAIRPVPGAGLAPRGDA